MAPHRPTRTGEAARDDKGDATNVCSDPLLRVLSALMPNHLPHVEPAGHAKQAAAVERIASQLVRRMSLGPTSVHLEFAEGMFSDGTLLVSATAGGLDIKLEVPAGTDAAQLHAALSQRLSRKGIKVSSLEVT